MSMSWSFFMRYLHMPDIYFVIMKEYWLKLLHEAFKHARYLEITNEYRLKFLCKVLEYAWRLNQKSLMVSWNFLHSVLPMIASRYDKIDYFPLLIWHAYQHNFPMLCHGRSQRKFRTISCCYCWMWHSHNTGHYDIRMEEHNLLHLNFHQSSMWCTVSSVAL